MLKLLRKPLTIMGLCMSLCLAPSAQADDSFFLNLIYLLQQAQLPSLANLGNIKNLNQAMLNNLEGNFGYGQLYNSAQDLQGRQWSNNNWTDVLAMASDGSATSAFAAAQRAYAQRYPIVTSNQFNHQVGVSALNQQYYQDNSNISRAALAASSTSYNQINQHMKTVSDILAALENKPSEKAAVDLNARLVAEQSFIALEQLRMQNMQTQLSATQNQASVNGMSDQANFMQWQNN